MPGDPDPTIEVRLVRGVPTLTFDGEPARVVCKSRMHAELYSSIRPADWPRLALVVVIIKREKLKEFDFTTWQQALIHHPWWKRGNKLMSEDSVKTIGRKVREILIKLELVAFHWDGIRRAPGYCVTRKEAFEAITVAVDAEAAFLEGYTQSRARSGSATGESRSWLTREPPVTAAGPVPMPEFDGADLSGLSTQRQADLIEVRHHLVASYRARHLGADSAVVDSHVRAAYATLFPGCVLATGSFQDEWRAVVTGLSGPTIAHPAEHALKLAFAAELCCGLRARFRFADEWGLMREILPAMRAGAGLAGGAVVRWAPARVLDVAIPGAALAGALPELLGELAKALGASSRLDELEPGIVAFYEKRFLNPGHARRAAYSALAMAGAAVSDDAYAARTIEEFRRHADKGHDELLMHLRIITGVDREAALDALARSRSIPTSFGTDPLWASVHDIVSNAPAIRWPAMCEALARRAPGSTASSTSPDVVADGGGETSGAADGGGETSGA